MIKVDISTALLIYLLGSVVAVLIAWVFLNFGTRMRDFSSEEKHIWNCSICTHTYIDSRNDEISKCPRCGSYNERMDSERFRNSLAEGLRKKKDDM